MRVLLLPLLVLAVRGEAGAQVVATSFEELRPLVKPGDTIFVTEANGRKTRARLGELTPSSLEMLVPKSGPDGRETCVPQSRLAERDVRQIATRACVAVRVEVDDWRPGLRWTLSRR